MSDNKTVVLFNGAPNSGKDESAKMMQNLMGSGVIDTFKESLYVETAKLFNVDLNWLKKVATDRDTKEVKNKKLHLTDGMGMFMKFVMVLLGMFMNLGVSPREALIYTSEKYIKPLFGDGYFGKTLAKRIEASKERMFYIPDSGFIGELKELIAAGYEVVVVRLHRDGCTFAGDSRNFLDKATLDKLGVRHTDLYNDGTLDDLELKVLNLATDFVLLKSEYKDSVKDETEA